MENPKSNSANKQSSLSSFASNSSGSDNEVQKHYNRNVWHVTSTAAKKKIESRVKQLEKISNEIHGNPEASHEEKETHKYLCEIFKKVGCVVHNSYIHPTAFVAEFQSPKAKSDKEGDKSDKETINGPTVGLICEYDAVPGFGHSCGHNLSTEASIGAVIGIKAAMKADTRLVGKIVIFGTPATEESGGKIQMIKEGAFDCCDVIVSAHPSTTDCLFPRFYASQKVKVIFHGISRHIECLNTIHGHNAVDAANLCYTNVLQLSNQIQPHCRIHCIIKRGGEIDYLVPTESELVFIIRAPNLQDLDFINKRLVDCCEGAAQATQTRVDFQFLNNDLYSYLIHNRVLANIFKEEANKVGINYSLRPESELIIYRATDMGNLSHKVPLIYPSFAIGTNAFIHTNQFTTHLTKPEAHKQTIKISIALSMTIIRFLLTPTLQQQIKQRFQSDLQELAKIASKQIKHN